MVGVTDSSTTCHICYRRQYSLGATDGSNMHLVSATDVSFVSVRTVRNGTALHVQERLFSGAIEGLKQKKHSKARDVNATALT